MRRNIDNDLSTTALQMRLIEAMPEIADKMPEPKELRSISLGGQDNLTALIAGLLKVVEGIKNGKAA